MACNWCKIGLKWFWRGTAWWWTWWVAWQRRLEEEPNYNLCPIPQAGNPPWGKGFFVGYFYHHSLISVSKDKLSNPNETQHFHYETFELLWQQHPAAQEVHVHGKLYTSPVFLEVHRNLQASLNEPGCCLQKVVVALMFSSDATLLTQFGTTKLWLGYLMFGNDSKYRHCKPTYNLCHHIAYFQEVGSWCILALTIFLSCLTTSKTLWWSTWAKGPVNLYWPMFVGG